MCPYNDKTWTCTSYIGFLSPPVCGHIFRHLKFNIMCKTRKHPSRPTVSSRHHLLAKSRGGTLSPINTLDIWRDKHDAWHRIFHNYNLDEIIAMLNCRRNPFTKRFGDDSWDTLFYRKSPDAVLAILVRLRRIKRSLRKRKNKQLSLFRESVQQSLL
jgi:hypothetical protein